MNKHKQRGLLFTVVAVTLMLIMTGIVFADGYADTSGHWGSTAISKWSSRGVIRGNDGEFRPDSPITRGEMATIFSTLLGLTEKEGNNFSDLSESEWYADSILKCKAAGIISGYTDGTVGAEKYITRQEASVMISRGLAISESPQTELDFIDSNSVESWAVGYVSVLSKMGIINGYPSGEFDPQGNINRASVVTMLDKAVSDYITAPGTYTNRTFTGIVIVKSDDVAFEGCTFENSVIIAEELSKDNNISIKDSVIRGSVVGAEVAMENTTVLDGKDSSTGNDTKEEQTPPAEGSNNTNTNTGSGSSGGGGGGGGGGGNGGGNPNPDYYKLTLKLESSQEGVAAVTTEASSLLSNTKLLPQILIMAKSKKTELDTEVFAPLKEVFFDKVWDKYDKGKPTAAEWKTFVTELTTAHSLEGNGLSVISELNGEISTLTNSTSYVISVKEDGITYSVTITKVKQ